MSQRKFLTAFSQFSQRIRVSDRELQFRRAQQRYLDHVLSTLPPLLPNSVLPPRSLLYGSLVSGTAFAGSDVDFCVTWATDSEPFVDVPRDDQPRVLGGIYQHLKQAFERDAARQGQISESTVIGGVWQPPTSTGPPSLDTIAEIAAAVHMPPGKALPLPPPPPPPASSSSSSASLLLPAMTVGRIFQARIPILECRNRLVTLPNRRLPHDDATAHSSSAETIDWTNSVHRDRFDVSASLTGCRNSLLLRQYIRTSHEIHAAALLLKQWGRRCRMLDARGGWLSPYALIVMFIHFLQATQRVPQYAVDVIVSSMPDLMAPQLSSACDTSDPLFWATPEGEKQEECLSEAVDLLHGFFKHFQTSFDFETDVVDIRQEKIASKEAWAQEWQLQQEVPHGSLLGRASSVEASEPPPPSLQQGSSSNGTSQRTANEHRAWTCFGHNVIAIRDPYEGHSLGRGMDFFRGERLRELIEGMAMKPAGVFYEAMERVVVA